jgi:hypothetical protein
VKGNAIKATNRRKFLSEKIHLQKKGLRSDEQAQRSSPPKAKRVVVQKRDPVGRIRPATNAELGLLEIKRRDEGWKCTVETGYPRPR